MTLGVLEGALRVIYYFSIDDIPLRRLEQAQRRRGHVGSSDVRHPLPLGDRIRLSPVRRIIYEWKPGLRSLDENGARHTINDAGFRGPTVPEEKARGVVRIVGLGDSVMYGSGVGDESVYLVWLAERLNQKFPGARWEAINTAVPGYNTAMEVATLEAKGLRYHPDLVILHFVKNDLGLPTFIRDPAEPLDVRRSFVADFILRALDNNRARLAGVPRRARRLSFDGQLAVPAEYRDLVGEPAFRESMRDLARLRDRHGFELLVVAVGRPQLVVQTCHELQIPFLSFRQAIQAFYQEHGGAEASQPLLRVSPNDAHPSAAGHAVMAGAILDHLASSGTIERLLARGTETSPGD